MGAYGGRRDLMALMAPSGPVYQAGTLSGNPLAMAAGRATLDTLHEDLGQYERLDARSQRLAEGLARAAEDAEVPLAVSRSASTVTPFFLDTAPSNWDQAKLADTKTFARFHGAMLPRGVHLAPSQFEAWFVSTAHDEALIDRTIEAAAESLRLARHA